VYPLVTVKYPEKFAMYIDKKKKYISREMIDRKEGKERLPITNFLKKWTKTSAFVIMCI
jgi:hypothetical protein